MVRLVGATFLERDTRVSRRLFFLENTDTDPLGDVEPYSKQSTVLHRNTRLPVVRQILQIEEQNAFGDFRDPSNTV